MCDGAGCVCRSRNLWMARPFCGVVVVEVSASLQGCKGVRMQQTLQSEVRCMVMKFSALQAGVQDSCTCTSVSREGNLVVGEGRESAMLKRDDAVSHLETRPLNRVSSAVWPRSLRKSVATNRAAQRRRDWIMQGRWWMVLADALVMRVLFVVTTLLVVCSSLLVALLGLRFWFLLLLPLLLFASLLIVPRFLASRIPLEIVPPSLANFAQEFKSSAGMPLLSTQELRSQSGILALKSHPGMLARETPSTPVPADPPLVRVLETYDLRSTAVKHFLGESSGKTGEQTLIQPKKGADWSFDAAADPPETGGLSCDCLDNRFWGVAHFSLEDFPRSEPGEQSQS